jgi:hypothetical protein
VGFRPVRSSLRDVWNKAYPLQEIFVLDHRGFSRLSIERTHVARRSGSDQCADASKLSGRLSAAHAEDLKQRF